MRMQVFKIIYVDGSESPEYGFACIVMLPDGLWRWDLPGGAVLIVRAEQVRAVHYYEDAPP